MPDCNRNTVSRHGFDFTLVFIKFFLQIVDCKCHFIKFRLDDAYLSFTILQQSNYWENQIPYFFNKEFRIVVVVNHVLDQNIAFIKFFHNYVPFKTRLVQLSICLIRRILPLKHYNGSPAALQIGPAAPRRVSYRRSPARRGVVDTHATLRRTLTRMGEPVEIALRHRSTRARRVVLLVDVSGSMSSYADALLRLAHRVTHGAAAGSAGGGNPRVETFSVGTRVTRLTPAMRLRDADRALVAAGETVPDWSGGTRLGEGVKVFLDRWGQRGLVRGAVVVVFSDGWERGDARLLGEQMARLHRLAHRVVWVNPHKGAAGYRPVQLGMAAALPHVDDFVAGHSLAAFRRVLEVVADA